MRPEKVIVIVCVILLTVFGLALNASVITTNSSFFVKSIFVVFLGFGIMLGIIRFFNFNYLKNGFLYVVAGILLIALLVYILRYGKVINGASRWLYIGGFSLQVSEFAKLYIITMLSYVIYKYYKNESMQLFAYSVVLLISLLVLLEPDLGMSVFFVIVSTLMFYVAGLFNFAKIKFLGITFGILFFTVMVGYSFSSKVHRKINSMISYQSSRIERYVDMVFHKDENANANQPLGYAGFYSEQYFKVKRAIENATWLGSGFSQGSYTKYLPARHNDYISVLALEEAGIAGVLILGILFITLFLAIIKISFSAESVFEHYITLGIGIMIFLQALLHFGVNFQVFPEKGISLPFVSYGGSSYLTNIIMIALVLKARVKG